jgi:hypothetical protein
LWGAGEGAFRWRRSFEERANEERGLGAGSVRQQINPNLNPENSSSSRGERKRKKNNVGSFSFSFSLAVKT